MYELAHDVNRFEWLTMGDERDFLVTDRFNGTPIGDDWKRYRVKRIKDDLSPGTTLGDFPTLGAIPVFSERAVLALATLLRGNGELLPLDCAEGAYYAFNVTKVVDALNVQDSKVKWSSTGRVMRVEEYAFHADRLTGLTIFKIPEQLNRVLVTAVFTEAVYMAELVGFAFKEVWSDGPRVARGAVRA